MKTLVNDYDAELAAIDDTIVAYKEQISRLNDERLKLLRKMKNADMDIVLQCIEEKGLSSKEVLELINSANK